MYLSEVGAFTDFIHQNPNRLSSFELVSFA